LHYTGEWCRIWTTFYNELMCILKKRNIYIMVGYTGLRNEGVRRKPFRSSRWFLESCGEWTLFFLRWIFVLLSVNVTHSLLKFY
jgi:hypothetical protein